MKRFRFRLQRILDLRVQIRDEARQELVRCTAERDHQIHILAQLQDEFLQVGLKECGTYSASDIASLGAYSERLTNSIDQQKIVVTEAIKATEAAQERYIEVSKEAKTLEMLRDKKRQEFDAAQLREEGALFDELAVQRATRGY
ncbi:MAG: flagellar export protein FliJ [Pseudomonadota bacterium]|jgi:flagellar FliJ protein